MKGKKYKIVLLKTILILFGFLAYVNVMAQPTPTPPDQNPVPITGIEYLIAAGAAFGAKKVYDKRKKK